MSMESDDMNKKSNIKSCEHGRLVRSGGNGPILIDGICDECRKDDAQVDAKVAYNVQHDDPCTCCDKDGAK